MPALAFRLPADDLITKFIGRTDLRGQLSVQQVHLGPVNVMHLNNDKSAGNQALNRERVFWYVLLQD